MATIYIDPTYGSNGAGTIADPKNTWAGLTLTANNTYLQKRGTTYVGASVRPASQVSDAATPLTIGAYFYADGSDEPLLPKPVIDHNGGTTGVSALYADTCTNVRFRDIHATNSLGALGGAIGIRRSVGVTVTNCTGSGATFGLIIQQDQASTTSVTTDIEIVGGEYIDNVGSGVCLRWGAVSTAILKRITISGIEARRNGTGKTLDTSGSTIPAGGISSYTQNKASIGTAGFTSYDIICDDNIVQGNNGYGINIEGFANESWMSSVSRNDVSGSGASGDIDSQSLWVGNSSGVMIEDNYVHDNNAYIGAGNGSGVGIFLDYNGTSSSGGGNCTVRRNIVARQFIGSTTAPAMAASAGILVLVQETTLVESNLVVDCRNGLSIGNGATTNNTTVRNNTFIRCANTGISVLPLGTNAVLTNNLIKDSDIGIFVNTTSTAGFAETYNSIFGCTTPKATGTQTEPTATALHASDLTVDPMLSTGYHPLPGSPLIGAGTHLGYSRDIEGNQRFNPPTIGAIEPSHPRKART